MISLVSNFASYKEKVFQNNFQKKKAQIEESYEQEYSAFVIKEQLQNTTKIEENKINLLFCFRENF